MFRPIAKFIYFKLMGWKVTGSFPKLKKYIAIVAPHTSKWDFLVGVLCRSIEGVEDIKYLGKAELFKFPYGWIFRGLGGYPVDRNKSSNMVDKVVRIFNSHDTFKLALAPEGTRKKVEKFKTGFYHIATKANVPIVMVGFDYKNREIRISEPFHTSGNMDLDMTNIIGWFKDIQGKIPDLNIK